MEPGDLDRLGRGALLELIRRREAPAERDAAIERRDAKMRGLEEELPHFSRPARTPGNSSLPPSRGQQASRAEWRGGRRGPKRGHVG